MRMALIIFVAFFSSSAHGQFNSGSIAGGSNICKQNCSGQARITMTGCTSGAVGANAGPQIEACQQRAREANDACQAQCDGVVQGPSFGGIPSNKQSGATGASRPQASPSRVPTQPSTTGRGRVGVRQSDTGAPLPPRPITPYVQEGAIEPGERMGASVWLPVLRPYEAPEGCRNPKNMTNLASICRRRVERTNQACAANFVDPTSHKACVSKNMHRYVMCQIHMEKRHC